MSIIRRLVLGAVAGLLVALLGAGILLAPTFDQKWVGWMLVVAGLVGSAGSLYRIVQYFVAPEASKLFQQKYQKSLNRPGIGRSLTPTAQYDKTSFKLFSSHPANLIPYFSSIIIGPILAFALAFVILKLIPSTISQSFVGAAVVLVASVFVFIFCCISCYMIGYLVLGEMLQNETNSRNNHLPSQVIKNFLNAAGMAATLSSIILLLFFTSNRRRQSSFDSLMNIGIVASLAAVSSAYLLYVQMNLASLAFTGKKLFVNFSEAKSALWHDRYELIRLKLQSGIFFIIPVGIVIFLFPFWDKFHFVSENWMMGFILGTICLAAIGKLLIEQTSVIVYFLKKYHPKTYQAFVRNTD